VGDVEFPIHTGGYDDAGVVTVIILLFMYRNISIPLSGARGENMLDGGAFFYNT
jgi:hypothetical protein